jgi:hypothetical protein
MRKTRRKRVAVASMAVALAAAGSAAAFQQLPAGDQVNNDLAAGINPALGVDGGEPTNADVVGGSLDPTKKNVPWAVFRAHTSTNDSTTKDQIFSRSFANGAWTTRGIGTVGGKSSASSTIPGSLNFDQAQDGEVPAIDFAGANRAVPWATWYEDTAAFSGKKNIFASRFDNNQNKWIFGGQGRGLGTGTVPVPSLNIHTDQDAENPSVAGGATVAGNNPGPWVTWQEIGANAPGTGKDQIFTVKPTGPGAANCDGIKPLGVLDSGHVPAIGGFCWNQVGVERLGPDPSMNIDRTRPGIEPDIAFTGPSDTVPWVIWYEKDPSSDGLHNNEMVFAAKGVPPASLPSAPTGTVDGGFAWVSVGRGTTTGTQGVLDNSAHGGFCGQSQANEEACSLNKNVNNDAEDPRVASGTMNPANATTPWVVWDETFNGVKQIFVSRLVGGTHFEVVNNGQPISLGANDSTRPDITFYGNTPYVSWREDEGGVTKGFLGHFVNAANPTFVLDENNISLSPTGTGPGQADVRSPISSGCTATPQNHDGSACQGSAVGTPFFLFTNTISNTLQLFAGAYKPDDPTTGGPSSVTTSSATVSGSVKTNGASVSVSFDYGTSTAYTNHTAAQATAPGDITTPLSFSAALTRLPANTVIHYRAVATSDFGTVVGQDQTFRTNAIPPPKPKAGHASFGHVSVSGTTASIRSSCSGNSVDSCRLSYRLTVTETLLGKKIVAIGARAKKLKRHKVTVTVGTASTVLRAGHSRTVKIPLNHTGKGLLSKYRTLHTTLRVTQSGKKGTVLSKTVTFKAPKPKKKHHS